MADTSDKSDDVPPLVRGCWTRSWIRTEDGRVDDTTTVVWIQLESKMADVRLAPELIDLRDRGALSECSTDELVLLSQSDSSSGYTICTPIAETSTGRHATAEWFSDGGVAFQPVSSYPEPGLLQWAFDDDDVMIERPPSGTYTEEWHRSAGPEDVLGHHVFDDGAVVYRAGTTAVFVRDRPRPLPRAAPLRDLLGHGTNADDATTRQLLISVADCEFSVGQQSQSGAFKITASTLPWRIGATFATSAIT